MAENTKINGSKLDEYSRTSVPLSQRKSLISLIIVWVGYVFVVTSMQVGGLMGAGSDIPTFFKALAISAIILTVIGTFIGIIAWKTGLTYGQICLHSFGKIGSQLVALMIVVTLIGWFSIDAYLIGQYTNAMFSSVPLMPVVIISGILMTLTAIWGIKAMEYLAYVHVSLVFVFSLISIYLSIKGSGGWAGLMAIKPTEQLPLEQLVTLGVGSFICGAVAFTPDILRFAKTKGQAVVTMVITMMLANPLMLIFGALGTIATGEKDIAYVLLAQGLLTAAFIVMLLNIVGTAIGCVYSGSLSLSITFTKTPRWVLVCGFGLLGTIGAVVGFYGLFGAFIDFLASTIPALAGVFIADYYFSFKRHYPNLDTYNLPLIRYGAFIAWFAGIAANYLIPWGFSSVNGVVVALVVRAILAQVMKFELKSEESQSA